MTSDTITELERRLEDGWQMCEAEPDHNRRMVLEDHWIELLRTYERAVDAERRHQDKREAA